MPGEVGHPALVRRAREQQGCRAETRHEREAAPRPGCPGEDEHRHAGGQHPEHLQDDIGERGHEPADGEGVVEERVLVVPDVDVQGPPSASSRATACTLTSGTTRTRSFSTMPRHRRAGTRAGRWRGRSRRAGPCCPRRRRTGGRRRGGARRPRRRCHGRRRCSAPAAAGATAQVRDDGPDGRDTGRRRGGRAALRGGRRSRLRDGRVRGARHGSPRLRRGPVRPRAVRVSTTFFTSWARVGSGDEEGVARVDEHEVVEAGARRAPALGHHEARGLNW